jgi:prephenate dehydratase
MKIAFQGEPGAFSEAAALEHWGPPVTTVPCETFDAVFAAVESGAAEGGLVPIENSIGGSIHRNYDLLLQHSLHITAEHYLRVHHCLIAWPGVTLADIRRVISHPQALAQCERHLHALTGVKVEQVYDTAGSVKMIKAQGDRTVAGIASRHAAEVYGLEVLIDGFEDDEANYTRFLAIAAQPAMPTKSEAKTSLVFSLHNMPGALFKALSVFALRDIDLSKIESRPLVGKLWEYFFYVDIAGSTADLPVARALEHLGEYAPMLRVLGSYPRHRL